MESPKMDSTVTATRGDLEDCFEKIRSDTHERYANILRLDAEKQQRERENALPRMTWEGFSREQLIQDLQDREIETTKAILDFMGKREELRLAEAECDALMEQLDQMRKERDDAKEILDNLMFRIRFGFRSRISLEYHLQDLNPNVGAPDPFLEDDDGAGEDAQAEIPVIDLDAEPNIEDDSASSRSSNQEPDETLYCDCQVIYEEGSPDMVCCDNLTKCLGRNWYHLECVGLDAVPGPTDKWYCHYCIADHPHSSGAIEGSLDGGSDRDDDSNPDGSAPSGRSRHRRQPASGKQTDSEDGGPNYQAPHAGSIDEADVQTLEENSISSEESSESGSEYLDNISAKPTYSSRTKRRRQENPKDDNDLESDGGFGEGSSKRSRTSSPLLAKGHVFPNEPKKPNDPTNNAEEEKDVGKDKNPGKNGGQSDLAGTTSARANKWSNSELKAASRAMITAITGVNLPDDLERVLGDERFKQASELLEREGIYRNAGAIRAKWIKHGLREESKIDERLYTKVDKTPGEKETWTKRPYIRNAHGKI